MGRIFENLKDPSWWFTTLFMAILAGLCTAYLRDYISLLFALTSKTLKVQRNRRLAQQEKYISNLISNPTTLILEYIRVSISGIMFFGLFCIFLMLPLFMDVVERIEELNKLDRIIGITDIRTKRFIYTSIIVSVGLYDTFLGFVWISNLRIMSRVRKEYVSQLDLNKPEEKL